MCPAASAFLSRRRFLQGAVSTAPAPATAIRLAGDFANYTWSRIDPAGQLRPLVTTSQNDRIEATLDETLPSLGCTFLLGRRTT